MRILSYLEMLLRRAHPLRGVAANDPLPVERAFRGRISDALPLAANASFDNF